MTASPPGPRASLKPTSGRRDKAALSLLPFGRDLDANRASWVRLARQAQCADNSLDADQWFPVSMEAESARREAADAIAVCRACPVRSLCLALSLLHWDVGQYGIWGGLVAADRASLRRQMLAAVPDCGGGPPSRPGDRRAGSSPPSRH